MPLYSPNGSFLSTADWADLERKIQRGDGLGWSGDPSLSLRVGVLKNTRTGKSGHRLEVWRHTELGEDVRIGHWLPTEQHMICYDLARMFLGSRGHVDSVSSIEAHNAKIEKEQSEKFQETMLETMRHAAFVQRQLDDPGAVRTHSFPTKPV